MRKEQRSYQELKYTTIRLQRRVKANQLSRKVRSEYLTIRKNLIQLQALWRGFKARQFVQRIKSAQLIQRRYRAYVEGRYVRTQFVHMRKAVVTVQACYRGNLARQRFKREQAARRIQALVRGHRTRVLLKV